MPMLNRIRQLVTQPVAVQPPKVVLSTGHDYFFVRGHPRSGTNWLGAVLNLHPQINCWGEFHFEDIRNSIDVLQSYPWQITAREPLRTVLDECFEDLVRRSIMTLRDRKPGARWIGDRTPRGLRVFLQKAPYFLIVRDGRDVLVSWAYHVLRLNEHAVNVTVPAECRPAFDVLYQRFKADPDHFKKHPEELLSAEAWVRWIADRWQNWMRADMASLADIRAGKPLCDGRVMELRYEQIHADPEHWRRKMYEFLGLDPDEALPLSSETRTAPGFESERPLDFHRHGKVGDWKRYMTPTQKQWFKESAGAALVEMGYERDLNW